MSVEFTKRTGKAHPGTIRGKTKKFDPIVQDCVENLPLDTEDFFEFELPKDKADSGQAAHYNWVSEHKDSPFRFKCSKVNDNTFRVWKVSR